MSKKVFVLGVQPDPEGPVFGRVFDPVQLQDAQTYAHGHTEQITKDLLMAGAEDSQVAGFGASLPGGLTVRISAGSVVDENGISYGLDANSDVVLDAADPANPRIDLIYATLEIDSPAESEFLPFRQLRTQAELEDHLDPYVPEQLNQPTETHNRAVIHVHTGVPAGAPTAPAAGAGEVPLWRVHVAAGQTVLGGGDLTDVRNLMKSLYQIAAELVEVQNTLDGAEMVANKGVAGGYPALDGGGKVPSGQLPAIFVLKAGDAMTGQLQIQESAGNTFALVIAGSGTAKGINIDLADGILIDATIDGDPAFNLNGRQGLGSLLTLVKAVNNTFLVEMSNPGGAAWGLHLDLPGATTVEPVLLLESGVGVVMKVLANGKVGIGTATPTSALHVVGLPVYANNAAALAGGLTAGAFYRTGGDPDPICVVH